MKNILIEKAFEARKKAYCPYSQFMVGAAVLGEDGNIYTGCNIENASYGMTVCAERVAIFSAIAAGYKKGDFKEIHIMVSSGEVGMPCFVCRQMLIEFFDIDSKVYCYSTKGEVVIHSLKDLCPYPFGKEDLI